MDTSEQYIKMCEKAEEIQSIWHDKALIGTHRGDKGFGLHYERGYDGSFYAWWDEYKRPNGGWRVGCVDYEYETTYKQNHVWLPRQDQLQKMVEVKALNWAWVQWLRFCVDENWIIQKYPLKFVDKSMEQLWLAFVMAELYQKIWDGEKWIRQ